MKATMFIRQSTSWRGLALALCLAVAAGCGEGTPAGRATAPAAPADAGANGAAAQAAEGQGGTVAEDAAESAAPTPTSAVPTPTPDTAGAESEPATETAAEEPASAPAAEEPPAEGAADAAPPPATFDPAQVQLALQPVAEGLDAPLFVTHAGDGSGRLFIVGKRGVIWILQEGQVLETPFLDITDRVGSQASEQGLLGLAFAPDYESSGYLFVNYTNTSGDTVVARFQVTSDDPNRADPASEFAVLGLDQPAANHNGGMLLFGPDGMLWIGTGDGGAANDRFGNGQNPATLLGKMLRLDVTSDPGQPYLIPPDNPWVDADWNGADVRDEVWAVGLRNPWRYSFDRATGDLWTADVGQNQYEEINLTPAGSAGGLNYGWPLMEGMHCFRSAECDSSGLVLPVAEYTHAGHCSVTGGYVYRGQAFPALNGVYLYGDYCSGVVWALTPSGDGGWQSVEALRTSVQLSSFGEDEAGELYVTDLSGGTVSQLIVAQ